MSARLWSAHGLVIRSDDLDLSTAAADTGARPDVTLTLAGRGTVPGKRQEVGGRRLAHLERDGEAWLTVVDGVGGDVVVHFHGVATAVVSADRSDVAVTLAEDAVAGYADVLAAGTLLAVVLMLRGHPVLHASAVVSGPAGRRSAIGFVGASGMGKSTLATLACRDGAALVTDDVLRVDDPGGDPVVWSGSTTTRLRAAAAPLGHQTTELVAQTADGRTAASLQAAGVGPFPLRALVIPRPDRTSDVLEVTRLSPWDAMLTLLRFPRVPGWSDPVTTAAAQQHLGALVGRVPVLVAQVPWGPPFGDGLGARLVAAVEAAADAGRVDQPAR